MKHNILLFLGTLLIVHATLQPSIPTDHFFPSRTGDIVIGNGNTDAYVSMSWYLPGKPLEDVLVHNLMARYFRVPRVYDSQEIEIPVDVFSRPSGNLLFSVDGFTPEGEYQTFKKGNEITSVGPNTPYSILASALTGVSTSVHGVVNGVWPNKKNDMYAVDNIFDGIQQNYPSSVNFVSGSSSYEAVQLLSPTNNGKSSGFYYDVARGQFVSVNKAKSKLAISKRDFSSLFEKLSQLAKFKISYSDSAVVDIKASGLSYDLSEPAVEKFFAEIMFVLNAAELVSQDKDMIIPNFFSFHFGSPRLIAALYGVTSQEYLMAMQLLDIVTSHCINSFGTGYANTIFYFPYSESLNEASPVLSTLLREFQSSDLFTKYYPHIYLNGNPSPVKQSSICLSIDKQIKKDFPNSNLNVYCAAKNFQKRAGAEPQPYNNPVNTWHVVAWMSLTLILVMITAIYYLFTMDTGEDSLLFFKSNMAMVQGAKGKSTVPKKERAVN